MLGKCPLVWQTKKVISADTCRRELERYILHCAGISVQGYIPGLDLTRAAWYEAVTAPEFQNSRNKIGMTTQLQLEEFLKACEIPSAQRNYTGSDSGTRFTRSQAPRDAPILTHSSGNRSLDDPGEPRAGAVALEGGR